MYMDVSGWGWVWMTAMMAFWAIVVLLIVVAVTRGFGHEQQVHRVDETPEGILARRFANGEIDQDEYRSALNLLSSPASGAGSFKAPTNDKASR